MGRKSKSAVFSISFTFIIFLPLITVQGLNFEIYEDFNDNRANDWDIRSEDGVGVGIGASTNHDFSINSGYLETYREFAPDVFNIATHELQTTYGVWQFDIFYPSIRLVSEFDWYFMLSDNFYGGIGEELTGYQIFDRTRNGTLGSISQNRIEIVSFIKGNTAIPNEVPLSKTTASEEWIHYDFVKTPDRFLVYIENKIYANFSYSDSVTQYGHISLMTNRGSGLKFDNIIISPEYSTFLESISGETKFSEKLINYRLFLLLLVFGIPTTVFTINNYMAKKRLLKLLVSIYKSPGSHLFNNSFSFFDNNLGMYFSILGQTGLNNSSDGNKFHVNISHELYQYRHILHPYRLGVMNLLTKHGRLSAIKIKKTLDLTWNDYSNTVKVLKKHGYITLKDDFENSTVRSLVTIESKGLNDFSNVTLLLEKFVNESKEMLNSSVNLYPIKD